MSPFGRKADIANTSERSVIDPKLNGRQRDPRSWNASVFSFRSIGANVAKFSRSLDEATFSPRAFLISHGLVAEAIDFPACHFGCLAPASFAELTRSSCCAVSKTAFHEQSDRHFPRGKICLRRHSSSAVKIDLPRCTSKRLVSMTTFQFLSVSHEYVCTNRTEKSLAHKE
jgi:hypothetical protein